MTHCLKTWTEYYEAVKNGSKPFELRKDDRKYSVGDTLILQKYDPIKAEYTGDETQRIITYILRDAPQFGLAEGCVILGLKEKEY